MKRLSLLTLLLGSFLLTSSTGYAQQAPPSSDTYVASSKPTTSEGTATILAVQPGVTSFVQFDLSGIPAGSTIKKATLRLYVDAVTTAGSFDVYQVNTAWSEKTTTYNNAPAIGASATGSSPTAIGTSNLKDFVQIDISNLAQNWVSGGLPNNGVALELVGTTGSFSFDSKEATTYSHEPELEVVLEGQAGQTGPQGPAGPAGPQGPQGAPGVLTAGSQYYVQNGTTTQTGTSFNIDGSGTLGATLTANAVNSVTGYLLGEIPFFSTDNYNNIHLGANAGSSRATAGGTQAIGDYAGVNITSGNDDVFLGSYAGSTTTTGNYDVYIGWGSGNYSSTGAYNTFVGAQAGGYNTTGTHNLYLGFAAGLNNSAGSNNIYLGNNGANESNTIRIGTEGSQTAAYIAGAYGATASGSVPLFINSNGQLGTGGGTISGILLTGSNTAMGGDGVVGNASQGDGVNGNSGAANKSGMYGTNSVNGGYGVTGRNTVDGSYGYLGADGVGVGGSSLNIAGDATIGGGLSVTGAIKAGNLVTVNGFVYYTGSIFSGTGFSVVYNYAGNYTVSFPAGTFSQFPIVTVQAFEGPAGNVVSIQDNSDGSAYFTVDFGGRDTNFMFMANQVNPGNLPAATGPGANASLLKGGKTMSPTPPAGNAVKAATPQAVTSNSGAQGSLHQALQQQVNELQQENTDLTQRLANLEAAVAKLNH